MSRKEDNINNSFVFLNKHKSSFYRKPFIQIRKLWKAHIRLIIDDLAVIIDYDLAKMESFVEFETY